MTEKYGFKNYQTARNDYHRNARDSFLIELAKWGLGPRDLIPNLNLFSKVVTDDAGRLTFVPGHSKPGDHIDLRFEMDVLVVLNTCQHPLDPDPSVPPARSPARSVSNVRRHRTMTPVAAPVRRTKEPSKIQKRTTRCVVSNQQLEIGS